MSLRLFLRPSKQRDNIGALAEKAERANSCGAGGVYFDGQDFPSVAHVGGSPEFAVMQGELPELFDLYLLGMPEIFGGMQRHLALCSIGNHPEQSLLVSQRDERGTGNFSLGYPQGSNPNGAGDLLEAEELVSETVSDEPAMWRNWWRVLDGGPAFCHLCGDLSTVETGEVFHTHCRIYPSKAAALQAAAQQFSPAIEHLGALPIGERP